MEKVNAPAGIPEVRFGAGVNPSGTVSGYHLDLIPFLLCQCLAEQPEDLLTISLVNPGDTIAINVIHNGNVLVPLMIRCLIDTNPLQPVQPIRYVWFNASMSCLDTIANCPPVDSHKLTDNSLGRSQSQKSCLIVESSGEVGAAICPWNVFSQHAMLRALNTRRLIEDIYRYAIQRIRPPGNVRSRLVVIEWTLLSTHRTCLANTLIGSGVNVNMIMPVWFTVHNSLIGHIFNAINMHALDVKSLHHYTSSGSHCNLLN